MEPVQVTFQGYEWDGSEDGARQIAAVFPKFSEPEWTITIMSPRLPETFEQRWLDIRMTHAGNAPSFRMEPGSVLVFSQTKHEPYPLRVLSPEDRRHHADPRTWPRGDEAPTAAMLSPTWPV